MLVECGVCAFVDADLWAARRELCGGFAGLGTGTAYAIFCAFVYV